MSQAEEDKLNSLLGAGAILGCLSMAIGKTALKSVNVVMDGDTATNRLDVEFAFLKSKYRITVERVEEMF